MGKTDKHTEYRKLDGTLVRGTTTIINDNLGRNKGALMGWVWKMAKAGKNPWKVRDDAGDVGTLAHYLIECHINGEEPDLHEYSPSVIERAEVAYKSYLEWEDLYEVETIESELSIVSEVFSYGGTLDLIASVRGDTALVDFKTSKNVYTEHEIQLAAYNLLYNEEFGEYPTSNWILHLDKEQGKCVPYPYTLEELQPHEEIFKHLLAIDRLWQSADN